MAAVPLRVLWDHLGLTLPIQASSAEPLWPAWHLETGDVSRYWKADSTAAQSIGYDATAGRVEVPDTLVIPGADYLVEHGFSVDLRWSDDGGPAGTSIGPLLNAPPFPWTPITAGHLIGPDAKYAVAEWNPIAKRGWYLHLYGTVAKPARLAGSLFLGTATDLPRAPGITGRALGAARTYRGRTVTTSWTVLPQDQAKALADLIARLTDNAAEGVTETLDGMVFGGLPAWLYDRSGRTFNGDTGTPFLLPVLCTTPAQAVIQSVTHDLEQAPTDVGWRERR